MGAAFYGAQLRLVKSGLEERELTAAGTGLRRTRDVAAAVLVRMVALVLDQRLERRTRDRPFEEPRLVVQAADRLQLLVAPEARLRDGMLQHRDRAVVHGERHRERMAVLSSVRK